MAWYHTYDIIEDDFAETAMQSQWENNMVKMDQMERKYMGGILEWETKINDLINVADMGITHIMNTIGYIKREKEGFIMDKWVDLFEIELDKRKRAKKQLKVNHK